VTGAGLGGGAEGLELEGEVVVGEVGEASFGHIGLQGWSVGLQQHGLEPSTSNFQSSGAGVPVSSWSTLVTGTSTVASNVFSAVERDDPVTTQSIGPRPAAKRSLPGLAPKATQWLASSASKLVALVALGAGEGGRHRL
jgi:hypothetical protein